MNLKFTRPENKVIERTSVILNPFSGLVKTIINTIALLVSWYFNKSILWGLFHFLFGTPYLIYSLLMGRFKGDGFMEIINAYI